MFTPTFFSGTPVPSSAQIIGSCIFLHNYCLEKRLADPDEFQADVEVGVQPLAEEQVVEQADGQNRYRDAVAKRQRIIDPPKIV